MKQSRNICLKHFTMMVWQWIHLFLFSYEYFLLALEVVMSVTVNVLPGHCEKNNADPDVAEDNANPNLLGKWIQEAENPWLLLHRFFDHDGDAKRHERLAEIDDAFSFRGYCHWRNGHIRFLEKRE